MPDCLPWLLSRTLSAASLVPKNHPYLGECMDHHIAIALVDYVLENSIPAIYSTSKIGQINDRL